MYKTLSEHYGQGEYEDRYSRVVDMGEFFHVEMYDDEGLLYIRRIKDHTFQYADDCAENWVIGVIKG